MGNRILILDSPGNVDLTPLSGAFQKACGEFNRVQTVTTGEELLELLESARVHMVVLEDVIDGDAKGGLRWLKKVRAKHPAIPVVVVVHENDQDYRHEIMEAGAADCLVRSDGFEQLVADQVKKINELIALVEKNRRLNQLLQYQRDQERSRYQMIGDSPQIRDLTEKISRVAHVPRPLLICGERGTGKELVARAIHEAAHPDGDRPLVVVNCAAFSDNLLESELFGYEPGAFTGAAKRHIGKFEQAKNGTLFLDEIGNMSVNFQQKIMRVVEYRTFRRVGGTEEIKVQTRIIGATNADLKKKISEGDFLPDLYDRLSFEVLQVPALREREGDIEILARFFLHRFMEEIPTFRGKRFSTVALEQLRKYPFPGNIRELKNIVERAVYRDTTNQITPTDMGLEAPRVEDMVDGVTFKEKTEGFEVRLINEALEACDNNQAAAARRLGLSYHQLRHHLKKYGDRIKT